MLIVAFANRGPNTGSVHGDALKAPRAPKWPVQSTLDEVEPSNRVTK